jgi:bacillolysin
MKNILYLLLLCVGTSYGQSHIIKIDPNKTVDKVGVKLQKQAKPSRFGEVQYKPLDINGINIGHNNSDGLPAYFSGKLTGNVAAKGQSMSGQAKTYLKMVAPAMKVDREEISFELKSEEKDEQGIDHLRFQQYVKGVPVYGAEVILHGQNGQIDFLNGNYHAAFEIENVVPTLAQEDALQLCIVDRGEAVKYKHFMGPLGDLMKERKELVIYHHDGKYSLAYHISSYRNLVERWEYFIDANTGAIIRKFESLCKLHNHKSNNDVICNESATKSGEVAMTNPPLDGKATANALDLFNTNRTINTYQVGSTYYMLDGSRDIFTSAPSQLPDDPEGVIWTIDAFNTSPERDEFKYDHVKSGNNSWDNKTAVSAHYNGGKAFEYFRNVHGRLSINGQKGNIVSLINVTDENDQSMGNAFWNGQAMFYGNGDSSFKHLARGLDVAAHEMTHGVVQSTANLVYEGESGALNESFADVFGALVDRDDYRIGEDVVNTSAFPSGALRSLEDPHNGQSTGNFNKGWQPRTYSERYKGTEDNGGVHINSGIPNWAFFKFATAVGKEKAEKVYYKALTSYLTKSSKFVDCRVAVVKAATDLYGTTEANAARKAFDEVEILGDSGGSYENNAAQNPGQDFVLVTDPNNSGLFLLDGAGVNLGKVSNSSVLSKPSISDDGDEIVFVSTDNKLQYITIDWSKNPLEINQQVLDNSPDYRNVIISKDGSKIAYVTKSVNAEIYVIDYTTNPPQERKFDLYNPTFTNGQETGDVNYADAMEFDLTGEYIMYDAENRINSLSAGSITYWDISFIRVWNNAAKDFSLGKVEKLFSSLPSDVSVGNPTFSKNSPYIIAFDYIKKNGDVDIYAANTERGLSNIIYSNDKILGYPNFSNNDQKLVFDAESDTNQKVVAVSNLKASKIEPNGNPGIFVGNRRWAVWFSNGVRKLSNTSEVNTSIGSISISQNPITDQINATANISKAFSGQVVLTNVNGQSIYTQSVNWSEGNHEFIIPASDLSTGIYNLSLVGQAGVTSLRVVKI